MIVQTVKSNTGSSEGRWVGGIIAVILLVATIAIPFHQQSSKQHGLESHQISVKDLHQDDLAMIAELRLAFEEIKDLRLDAIEINREQHQSNRDLSNASSRKVLAFSPSVRELEENWIAPFVHDKSWVRKGEHQWSNLGNGFYFGRRVASDGAANVVLNTQLSTPDIWLANEASLLDIDGSLSLQILLDKRWKQVAFTVSTETH
ncbi:DUF6162 family protein [Vibrio genomosp. F6]|uniref:Uncharacterized protein n=1 Tax=Vibrio genomosp. F6 str. FF-238 TaxID=1191298 RepID=A0A1E5CLM4_9VIBR|nr:hypothetical protein [Vibrio genomosp. F6]OEE69578.1 hypothetical protein A130_09860 [Vibrio genomosp. F6 str. FF-238]